MIVSFLWFALAVGGGCALNEPPGPLPTVAAMEVVKTLDDAVRLSSDGDPGAIDAWSRAFDRFEASVEPALRDRVAPSEVASTEYRFAVIRAALEGQGDPSGEVAVLATRLHEQLAIPAR